MYPTGIAVGIPLTILQLINTHLHTGNFQTTSGLIVSNFLLSHAIYDADRCKELVPSTEQNIYKTSTSIATTASAIQLYNNDLYYLIPFLILLHTSYSDLKSVIGPIKPFFVAFIWTIAVLSLIHISEPTRPY